MWSNRLVYESLTNVGLHRFADLVYLIWLFTVSKAATMALVRSSAPARSLSGR